MASRNRKAEQSQTSSARMFKKDKKLNMSKSSKIQSREEDQSSDDEEDALEMERNFALLSKKGTMPTSVEDEEGYSDEEVGDEDAAEDEEEFEQDSEDEDKAGDDEAVSGSDEDESVSSPEEDFREEESKMTTYTENDVKKRRVFHIYISPPELSNMSFEEIMKLQNKVGTKAYNKIAFDATKQKPQKTEPMKRLNKHRPQEISAKKRAPFLRKVIPVKKNISRDPRFDDLSGQYKPEIFNHTYKFINGLKEQEMQIVRKKLKKAKHEDKREDLKALLKRMENQQRARQRQVQDREKELQFKRKQRELVGQGHKPFYLKKSDKKKMELAEKYSELKKSGKLENFLSKKRKRNATKDRRKLPNQHKAR